MNKKAMNWNTAALVIVILMIATSIYYIERSKAGPGGYAEEEKIDEAEEISLPEQLYQNDTGISDISPQSTVEKEVVAEPEKISAVKKGSYPKAPELVGISGYINTEEGLKIYNLRGKVVLVDFWTYTCINCIRTFPHLVEWDRKYSDKGLVIIGVHTPEFQFEKKYENVKMATERYGIKYPVVQDNDYATWRAYRNRFWPHKYLIDSEGYVRFDHIGEGAYEETEERIQELLAEIGMETKNMSLSEIEDITPTRFTTPELYAGFDFALPRNRDIGNPEGLQPGQTVDYELPESIKSDYIYLDGKWKSNRDNLQAMGDNSSIILKFLAYYVNIVADTLSRPLKLEVFVDGNYVKKEQAGDDVVFEDSRAFVIVDEPMLYNVVRGGYGVYTLKLVSNSSDFTFNAFTFG